MGAGDGAYEQSRRQADRAARLREELARAEAAERSWSAGAEGERRVAAALEALVGWQVVHDARWPGRPRANIDHIAVGPAGIVVVDAKNWSGSVGVRDGVLRQNSHRRDRATAGVVDAVSAVAAILEPQHRLAVRPVLCLAGAGADSRPVRTADGVVVVGVEHLWQVLAETGAVALSEEEVAHVVGYLRHQLLGPASPALQTTRTLQTAAFATEPARSLPGAKAPRSGRPRTRPAQASPARGRQPAARRRRRGDPPGIILLKLAGAGVALMVALNVLGSLGAPG